MINLKQPNIPQKLPKRSWSSFQLKSDVFKKYKFYNWATLYLGYFIFGLLYIWATFEGIFVTKKFSKSHNLVTLNRREEGWKAFRRGKKLLAKVQGRKIALFIDFLTERLSHSRSVLA